MNRPSRMGMLGGIAISILIGVILILLLAFLMRAGLVGVAPLDAHTTLPAVSPVVFPYL